MAAGARRSGTVLLAVTLMAVGVRQAAASMGPSGSLVGATNREKVLSRHRRLLFFGGITFKTIK